MSSFTFLYEGSYHTDTSIDYLQSLGCSEETITAILDMKTVHDTQWIELRAAAYKRHSDPLFIEWQYDEDPAKGELWRAEVLRIKEKYPKTAGTAE